MLWEQTCRRGQRLQPIGGFEKQSLRDLFQELITFGPLRVGDGTTRNILPNWPTTALEGVVDELDDWSLERIRAWAEGEAHAVATLVMLLALIRRTDGLGNQREWLEIAQMGTDAQPGLLRTLNALKEQLKANPTVVETMSWLVNRFVLQSHEAIAYSKYPEFHLPVPVGRRTPRILHIPSTNHE